MDLYNQQPEPLVSPSQTLQPQQPQSKNWVLIIVIIVITALIASAATYFAVSSQKQTQPQLSSKVNEPPSPTPSPSKALTNENDPTANWNTYVKKELGFSIDIPPVMNLIQEGPTGAKIGAEWSISWANTSKEESAKKGSDYSILIEITSNPKNIKGESITTNNLDTLISTEDIYKVEKITYQNRPTVKNQYKSSSSPFVQYNILDSNRLIRLYGTSENINLFNATEIDQILSTFRFTR